MTLSASGPRRLLTIVVRDTGIGIKPEDMPRLFREFEQIESTNAPKPEGTGLGLAISRRFAELHGGTLDAESVFGRGSTFTLRLPVQAALPSRPASSPRGASPQGPLARTGGRARRARVPLRAHPANL